MNFCIYLYTNFIHIIIAETMLSTVAKSDRPTPKRITYPLNFDEDDYDFLVSEAQEIGITLAGHLRMIYKKHIKEMKAKGYIPPQA